MGEASLFEGKTVALVGNAQSMFDSSLGAAIDSHDVVCRINFGLHIRDPVQQGRRTDLWFVYDSTRQRAFQLRYPSIDLRHQHLIIAHMMHDPLLLVDIHRRFGLPPFTHLGDDFIKSATTLVGAKPSTGFLAAEHISQSGFSKLSLFGFDWKATKSWYHSGGSDNLKKGEHDWEAERRLFFERFLSRPDVSIGQPVSRGV